MAYLSLTTGTAISTGNRASGVSCRGIVVESVEAQVQATDSVFASDQILVQPPQWLPVSTMATVRFSIVRSTRAKCSSADHVTRTIHSQISLGPGLGIQ